MKSPDAANIGAFARNLVIKNNQRVAQSPSEFNVYNYNSTNENPGATTIASGAKDVYEAGQLPPFDSPEWAGAPAIILRHFCGVAA